MPSNRRILYAVLLTLKAHPLTFVTVYALGFFLRIAVRQNQNSLGLFVVMQLFLVCSPAAFLAFNYIVYGRLIQENIGAKYSLIRPSIVARVFVISDVVTFIVQVLRFCLSLQSRIYKLIQSRVLAEESKLTRATPILGQTFSSLVSSFKLCHMSSLSDYSHMRTGKLSKWTNFQGQKLGGKWCGCSMYRRRSS